jgi:hypothetical protein
MVKLLLCALAGATAAVAPAAPPVAAFAPVDPSVNGLGSADLVHTAFEVHLYSINCASICASMV